MPEDSPYDVVVIGAGHAGCEAALAAARMGCRTLLLTLNLDNVALMPCNPSIGGPAKGHLVREIDALGGEMARIIDRTFIQIRLLNTGKGVAVQIPRAQADKRLYSLAMKHTLERQANLAIKQALVEEVAIADHRRDNPWPLLQVRTNIGWTYQAKTVVVTTGTFLDGRIIVGDVTYPAGRAGEFPAVGLSASLRRLGFTLGRLKTGTPPRIDARTIDFAQTVHHPGSDEPLYFGFYYGDDESLGPPSPSLAPPNPIYPNLHPTAWRPQVPCYQVYTNAATHAIIRANLHRAPLYTGMIQGVGPRYCPSIEDKIVRFADKETHSLFLEPEGWETNEVYVQGANTSLPEDVQLAMLRTIPALRQVEMVRVGYAIEYDYVPSSQTLVTMESKAVPGLFFAGQINGTSGYEEAAAQGIIAGINAALKVQGRPPFVLRRDQAYIGVMLDDLTTKEITEPYRLLTSRAEFRLLLRQDNADLRLTPFGYELGLISRERYAMVTRKQEMVRWALEKLDTVRLAPSSAFDHALMKLGLPALERGTSGKEFMRRPEVTYKALDLALGQAVPRDVAEQVEIEAKYEGYIQKQRVDVERMRKLEERRIPPDTDYQSIAGLRIEAKQKLSSFRPVTIGQASRIGGVTPADVAVLLVHLQRLERRVAK